MARSCGADPEAMAVRDGEDLEAYLVAADHGRDARLGRRLVEEEVIEDA
jgi:hypothetical protein